MKIRTNYVSNSSSSSFLVSQDVSNITPCIKLSKEIWKALEKNYCNWDGEKLNLSEITQDWWLTSMVYDGENAYDKIVELQNTKHYLEGNDTPYDYYDNQKRYTVFKKDYNEFYIDNNDLFKNDDDIPEVLSLKKELEKILKNNSLNKSQKLNAISHLLEF